MSFGLKNAPSEFQNIMNDIFNPYTNFSLVYIDDVLIFSNFIEHRFNHLDIFQKIVRENDLVVSTPKIKLFQTRIRFLGFEIYRGMIKPIQRSIEFSSKFPDEIKDLLDKNLIRKSHSPWSCVAFYVKKPSKIERSAPRLVINYKPLNKVFKWIRFSNG